jgi:hypothetical protein
LGESPAGRELRAGSIVKKDVKKFVSIQAATLMFFGLAQILSGQNAPDAAAAGRHKVQVNERALGQTMAAAGATLIADYGGYQLYDAPASMTNLPPVKAELRDDYNLILLNASHLDTTTAGVKALRTTVGSFAGKRMHLVQFAGPVQPDWRQSLLDAGVQIVSYIPQNTYLIYGDAPAIARVQALAAATPLVQWEGAYLDDYKIHPSARPAASKIDQFAIQLMSDDAANAETLKLIDQLKLAPVERQRHVLNYLNVVVRVTPADLAQIAARPDVVSIQPYGTPRKWCERQDQIVAGHLSGNVPSGPGYLAWLQSKGFNQSQFTNFSVDLSDSGVDDGTTHPNHFGLYMDGIISSNTSKIIYNRLEGTPNPGSTLIGCDGHGNINAHIVCGYDNSSGFPFEDTSGYHYGLGVCPFVSLGSSVIFDPTNWTNPDYDDLMSQAYEDGARISNNSWGDDGVTNIYNSDSQEYDALVRDAQPEGASYPAAGNQEMVIVFASGNSGPSAGSVSPPATGKNVITVGAAENVQPFGGANDGADFGATTDDQASDANSILYFSSEGPCADGRQKPDLVAPGSHVSGGVSQAANPGPVGAAEPCFLDISTNEIGVDGGPNGSRFFPTNGQEFYTASSGTSHATPCVSGGCALLRQYFINQSMTPPSPALTKAWLMNAARYLTGTYADDPLWSPGQGMGEMNLGTALDGVPRFVQDETSTNIFTASGQTRVFTGVIANAAEPFRVTLAWTDAPGSTTGDAYNNNLILKVMAGGNTYYGNVFSGSNSVTGGSTDLRNNVQSVFLPAGVSGNYTVTIMANSINSVGVPGAAGSVNQDFALVVYNSGVAPAPVADGAVLAQGSCEGAINPGANVTVDFILRNAGSASTSNLVATLLFTNGVAFPSGPQTYGALAPGATGTNAYTFIADGCCMGVITATLQLQDGAANLGTASYTLQLGQSNVATLFSENFDEVTAPNLPSNWTSSATSTRHSVAWKTESTVSDSPPNAVYCPDSAFTDEVFLTSPSITLTNGAWQLSFRQSYDLEDTYDGGVLQISIGGGAFTDILAAGGSFVTNGYNEVLTEFGDPTFGPLYNQSAWSGGSGGFITTIVNLPPAAEDMNFQLRWACGTDLSNAGSWGGWWIDTILISQTSWYCCPLTNSAVPMVFLPTNGYVTTNASVQIAGTAMAGEIVNLYVNGNSNETISADCAGIFNAQAALPAGTNVLVLTNNGTTNFISLTVVVMPPAPTLNVASFSSTNVLVSGSGLAGAVVNIFFTNGMPAATFTNNASGNYSNFITLPVGTYSMEATEYENGLTSTNSPVVSVTVIIVSPPTLNVAALSTPAVAVSGTGMPGAALNILTNGVPATNFTINASSNYAGTVNLPDFVYAMSATETFEGVTSGPSAATTVTVITVPVPVFVFPAPSGLMTTNGSLTITGIGTNGATVTVYDGTNILGMPAVGTPGTFSLPVTLTNGIHELSASETLEGLSSQRSAAVMVTVGLAPVITVQPQSLNGFLKEKVIITAGVFGATPLRVWWERNGLKISGATTTNLTLTSLSSNSAASYVMVATNMFGGTSSEPAVLTLANNPFTGLTGTYYGLFQDTSAQFESSGFMKLTLGSLGTFSASILNAGGSYSVSGAFSITGKETVSVSRGAGVEPLIVNMNLDVTGGTEQILGTVSNATWSAPLQADRATFGPASEFTLPGKFTMSFGNTSDGGESPGGDGYGRVSISTAGMVTWSGALADGTSVAPASVSISKYGQWPLYIPLYGKLGSLTGWITITDASTFAGNAKWFRVKADGKLYPAGFTNALSIAGSSFTAGTPKIPALASTNLDLTLSGGDLGAETLTSLLTLYDSGKFETNSGGIVKLTLSVAPSTGLISGSFQDPLTLRTTTLKGVVLQQQGDAFGFFVSTNATGSFMLTPP